MVFYPGQVLSLLLLSSPYAEAASTRGARKEIETERSLQLTLPHRVEATSFFESGGIEKVGDNVESFDNDDYVAYNVDFGTADDAVNLIRFYSACPNRDHSIELHLGSAIGELIGTLYCYSANWYVWKTDGVGVSGVIGEQTLFLVSKGSNKRFSWFELDNLPVPPTSDLPKIESMSYVQNYGACDWGEGGGVGCLDNNDYLGYFPINFGPQDTVKAIELTYTKANNNYVRVDFSTAPSSDASTTLGSFEPVHTGGWRTNGVGTFPIDVEGVHQIFMVTNGNGWDIVSFELLDYIPFFSLIAHGEKLAMYSSFPRYYYKDTASNPLQLEETTVTMKDGNHWKYLILGEDGVEITEDTVLQFDFTLTKEAEIHAICLDEDSEYYYRPPQCFAVAGSNLDTQFIHKGIERTTVGETKSYAIRLSEFIPMGNKSYLGLIQKKDSSPKTEGESAFSNIVLSDMPQSCLRDVNFKFEVDECTVENFLNEVQQQLIATSSCENTDPMLELIAFFENSSGSVDVYDHISKICSSAHHSVAVPFEVVTIKPEQFVDEFMNGGTTWNYERSNSDGTDGILVKDAGRILAYNRKYASNKIVSWPNMHNFDTCNLRAAMCCYVTNRLKSGEEDNSDVCYTDFTRSQQSSHVRDGYSIYNDDLMGNLKCHGFAWGNDDGYVESVLKGNNLFNIAMVNELYETGNVQSVPGAPMCGCVESMPVVTEAECTSVSAKHLVVVSYNADLTDFKATMTVSEIAHSPCETDVAKRVSLDEYYSHLVSEGKATPTELEKLRSEHLVGKEGCNVATGNFLATKGFQMIP